MLREKTFFVVLTAVALLGGTLGAMAAMPNRAGIGSGPAATLTPTASAPASPTETNSDPSAPDTATPAPPTAPPGTEQASAPAPAQEEYELVITPGAVGPIRAGMSKSEALETGYFDADVPTECDPGTVPLQFKEQYTTMDVLTLEDGEVTAIGVHTEDGPRTRSGFGVGTTWGELKGAIGRKPETAGHLQTGVFVYGQDSDGWIGFLFDTAVEELSDDDRVMLVEVAMGVKPDLIRSGC